MLSQCCETKTRFWLVAQFIHARLTRDTAYMHISASVTWRGNVLFMTISGAEVDADSDKVFSDAQTNVLPSDGRIMHLLPEFAISFNARCMKHPKAGLRKGGLSQYHYQPR